MQRLRLINTFLKLSVARCSLDCTAFIVELARMIKLKDEIEIWSSLDKNRYHFHHSNAFQPRCTVGVCFTLLQSKSITCLNKNCWLLKIFPHSGIAMPAVFVYLAGCIFEGTYYYTGPWQLKSVVQRHLPVLPI